MSAGSPVTFFQRPRGSGVPVPERIRLGRFNIVGGQGQEEGPYAAVSAGRSVAESVADLYLTLQPNRGARAALCAELVQAATQMFGRPQYSVTGNLLLALSAAHQHVCEWNRTSLAHERTVVGVSCLARSGRDAFIAQAGASVVFFRRNGRTLHLQPDDADAWRGLGEADALAPWFHHVALGKGDQIVLASGGLGARLESSAVERCLAAGADDALGELYRCARADRDCGVILLDVLDELPDGARSPSVEAANPPGSPGRPLVLPPGSGLPRRDPSPLGGRAARRVQALHPDAGTGVLRVLGGEAAEPGPRTPAAAGSRTPAVAGAGGAAGLNVRLGARAPSFRSLGGRSHSRVPRGPALVVGALALLGLALWFGLPALASSGRTQRFQSLLASAQSELNRAQQQQDLSQKRDLLKQAQTNADEASQLKPADPRAQAVASSVSGALTVMDAVYDLPDVLRLADLSTAGTAAGISPSSAVELASGDRYYVLDVAAGKVLGVSLSNGAAPDVEVVYEQGSSVDGVAAGAAQHIAWQPGTGPNDPGTLLILDANRHLFGLSRGNLRSIPLRGVEQWHAATAMAYAGGDLYVLDAPGGLVWRYQPSADGFDTDPAPAVARADIRDTTQMSVVGGVFLVGQDGTIRRFLDGQETPFKLAGIDRPPASPQPPLYDAQANVLYVGDRADSRVIVLQADGSFQRQLVHPDLAGLRGLAVDSANGRLVGVIGQALVAIPLPH